MGTHENESRCVGPDEVDEAGASSDVSSNDTVRLGEGTSDLRKTH